jgi:hypothetical protein
VINRLRGQLGPVFAWLVFPLVPVALEDFYRQALNYGSTRFGPDPHEWDWVRWVLMLGPLV